MWQTQFKVNAKKRRWAINSLLGAGSTPQLCGNEKKEISKKNVSTQACSLWAFHLLWKVYIQYCLLSVSFAICFMCVFLQLAVGQQFWHLLALHGFATGPGWHWSNACTKSRRVANGSGYATGENGTKERMLENVFNEWIVIIVQFHPNMFSYREVAEAVRPGLGKFVLAAQLVRPRKFCQIWVLNKYVIFSNSDRIGQHVSVSGRMSPGIFLPYGWFLDFILVAFCILCWLAICSRAVFPALVCFFCRLFIQRIHSFILSHFFRSFRLDDAHFSGSVGHCIPGRFAHCVAFVAGECHLAFGCQFHHGNRFHQFVLCCLLFFCGIFHFPNITVVI